MTSSPSSFIPHPFAMSMRLAVNCPFCKRPMATSAAQSGQMVACPNCRGEFVLNTPALTPAAAAPIVASPVGSSPARNTAADLLPPPGSAPTPASRIEPMLGLAVPAATAIAEAPDDLALAPLSPPLPSMPLPAPVPPSPPVRTARLKTAASSAPAISPSADGKLPELQLADDPATRAAGEGGERPVPLWLACVAIAGSTVLSVFLLLGDAPAQKSAQSRTAEVRQDIATFYGNETASLRSYQVLLREAQQAHSRGDHATEKQRYRQVLALLRSEKRSRYENVTGTPGDDERLAELVAILLSSE
jgi:hypothetical protein